MMRKRRKPKYVNRNWKIWRIFSSDGEMPTHVVAVSPEQAVRKAAIIAGYGKLPLKEIPAEARELFWYLFKAEELNEDIGTAGINEEDAWERILRRFSWLSHPELIGKTSFAEHLRKECSVNDFNLSPEEIRQFEVVEFNGEVI